MKGLAGAALSLRGGTTPALSNVEWVAIIDNRNRRYIPGYSDFEFTSNVRPSLIRNAALLRDADCHVVPPRNDKDITSYPLVPSP